MIKGRITQIDQQSPETHHVQQMGGFAQEIVTRRGRTTITFDVTEMSGDVRGFDFLSADWEIVLANKPVSSVVPEQPVPIVYGSKDAGTW